METCSKTAAADSAREKKLCPPPAPRGVVRESVSLSSYKDYPAHRPFINTLVHYTPQTHTQHSYNRPASPSKAFPETSSAVILSALRNLQEKIRRLEFEKAEAELSLRTLGKDAMHTLHQRESAAHLNDQKNGEGNTNSQSSCNQVLITHLAAAESRCVKLERQLDHMRRMLRNTRTEKTSLLNQQASMERAGAADKKFDTVSEHAQMEKLEQLEREYLRLTRTQRNAEVKIREMERKLQEEEHQRKLIQDKANQLQTGLEANRILLKSVSPRGSIRQSKDKKFESKRSFPSYTEPHYRLSLRDVPFVTGTSVGCSHSVRANVQAVLSLLKCHQPCLCNSRVLSPKTSRSEMSRKLHLGTTSSSSSSSSSLSTTGEELSELLQALQEELHLMSLEQDELMRQVENSVSEEDRKELQREQERLLLKMERKGEQISKLHKHKSQEASSRQNSGNKDRVSTKGRSTRLVKVHPGERRKRNLTLLRDMKAMQALLRT